MKFFITAILALFVMSAQAEKHLFILSGQSNMAGLNPKISFIPAVEKEFGKENVIVIKDASGGKPIRLWYKEWKDAKGKGDDKAGTLYDRMMTKVNAAIKGQKLTSVTFLWMQGERDAKESHGTVYKKSFMGVISQLQKDLDRKDINFVIGRLSDFDMTNKRYKHWTMVRDIQVELAKENENGEWVDTDDLNNKGSKDDLHYTKDGYKIFGERLAEKAIKLIKK